jgi:ABC-2 type transport system ATP-binding protein
MSAIEVTNLQKTFQTKRKTEGLGGSVRSLFKPEYGSVEAVRRLTFQMEAGELLGFIGPNGAGKSTTIKMLTGILHPSGGDAKVLGFVPWKERQKLAYHIGTVFGQRPQLWYHLPAIDTFTLFGKIYEMDDRETKRRIGIFLRHSRSRTCWRHPCGSCRLGSGCGVRWPPHSCTARS